MKTKAQDIKCRALKLANQWKNLSYWAALQQRTWEDFEIFCLMLFDAFLLRWNWLICSNSSNKYLIYNKDSNMVCSMYHYGPKDFMDSNFSGNFQDIPSSKNRKYDLCWFYLVKIWKKSGLNQDKIWIKEHGRAFRALVTNFWLNYQFLPIKSS